MKLQTSIKPRRDGTLTVTAKDGQRFAFAAGPDGELVGDVTDEATVAHLLATGLYWPANPEDFDGALKLSEAIEKADDDLGDDLGDELGDDDGDDADVEVVGNGLPQESNTPPASFKPAKGGKKAK